MMHYPRVSEDFLQRWAIDWIDVKQRMDQVFYFCGTKKQDKKHKLMLTSSFSKNLKCASAQVIPQQDNFST